MVENKEIKNIDKTPIISLYPSIKSFLTIKKIFTYLSNVTKLKLVIYNKLLQSKLGIDIELYKKQSGKYIIDKKDGLGKEYILNTEILLYEGRYKNRKRNGYGKEYNNKGNLIFKGLFLDGKKRNGYLKEYYDNGNIKYKGDIMEGKKNGKGKEYFDERKLILFFEGEYLNEERNGKWKEYEYYESNSI